jgi:hypothetical protein
VRVLERPQIEQALERMAALLRERDTQGEICLLGGAVMVLAFKARPATKDVDAIFEPTRAIREVAERVRDELDLPTDWLNDGAKGFLSANHAVHAADLPQYDGLRVTVPTAEYMLAMKCMASRIAHLDTDPSDVEDIRFLLRHLGIARVEEAMGIISRFYPRASVPPRAEYLLEELLSEGAP